MLYCPQFRFVAIISEPAPRYPGKVEFSVLSAVSTRSRLCSQMKISDRTPRTCTALKFLSIQEKCPFCFHFYFNIHSLLEQRLLPYQQVSFFRIVLDISAICLSFPGSYFGVSGTIGM